MKSLKKNVISLMLLLLVLTTSPLSVFASSESASEPKIMTTSGTITPYGNITGYKYKILNGRQWKRLWSYTYNKWVDRAWTLA